MRVVVFKGKGFPLTVTEFPKPKVGNDEVLIRLACAAINHHELWALMEDSYLANKDSVIPGADGCGVVEEVGPGTDRAWIGNHVVINPGLDWGNNAVVQGDSFRILGDADQGTFADYIVVPKNHVVKKPTHLTAEEAAAVPLSGLTAYRALFTKANLQEKEKVLITGIGGGAALWALQLAVASGARVSVTSGVEEKLRQAKKLGAVAAYNYKDSHWPALAAEASNGFDVIIDSAGGEDFAKLVDLAAPGGRIVNFGRTAGSMATLNIRKFFWKQLTLFGTSMGTPDEFSSMIKFVEDKKIKPVIDRVYSLNQIAEAFDRMKEGNQFGKIILKIA